MVRQEIVVLYMRVRFPHGTPLGWSNGKMQVSKTLRWGFESLTLRQVLLAQWNRAVGYEPMCREFESLKGRLTDSCESVTI